MKEKLRMASATALFGTLAIFVKDVALDAGEIAWLRALLGGLFLLLVKLCTGKRLPLRELGRDLPVLLLSGVAMAFNWICLFQAYRYTTVSVASVSYYFAPTIVMIISPFLFHDKLTIWQGVCFIMSTVGLLLVVDVSQLWQGVNGKGVLFSLGAAVLYATVILCNRCIKNVKGSDRTLLQLLAAALVLTPYLLLTGGIQLGAMGAYDWVCMAVLGIIYTGCAYTLYFGALPHLSGQETAILSYLDPLLAIVVSFAVFHESMGPWQVVGCVMILGFTLLNELPVRKGAGEAA